MCRVVYRVSAGEPVEEVSALLRSHGLSPVTLDSPNPDPFVQYAAKGTYRVRIAVPEPEVGRAVKILTVWEQRNAALVLSAARLFRRQVLIALVPASLLAVLFFVILRNADAAAFSIALLTFFVAATLGTVIVGLVQERARRTRTTGGHFCEACEYPLRGLIEARCPECGQQFDPALIPQLDVSAETGAKRDPHRPVHANRLWRRLLVAALCLIAFDWSFQHPGRPAVERYAAGHDADEDGAHEVPS